LNVSAVQSPPTRRCHTGTDAPLLKKTGFIFLQPAFEI
jgi:hypothetical protein